MAITSKKITTTTVLKGGASAGFLPVHSIEYNRTVDDLVALDTKVNQDRAITSANAINATATASAAIVATGYITSTSAAATVITLPTGTLLGAYLRASQGTTMDLYIDNTAGANTVTIGVAVNGILSAAAVANAASFGLLTVPSGVTGQARFSIMFSSPTAYTFTRTA